MKPTRIEILGVPVDCLSFDQAVARLDSLPRDQGCQSILAVNPEKVMRAQQDQSLLAALQRSALLIPDGIGVVLAARLLAGQHFGRVPGAELMPEICRWAAETDRKVFLFGASENANARAADVLLERIPDLKIAGRRNGYVASEETPKVIAEINQSGADILFVALGSPAQELWIAKHQDQLQVDLCQGIGGTLDVLSGKVRRAPAFFRALNLEWFYRLVSNPRRLLRQTALPRFAWHIFKAWCRSLGGLKPSTS